MNTSSLRACHARLDPRLGTLETFFDTEAECFLLAVLAQLLALERERHFQPQ